MFVIAFIFLVIAGCIFLFEFAKANWSPYSMLAFALQAFGLALWLYRSTNDLNGVLK